MGLGAWGMALGVLGDGRLEVTLGAGVMVLDMGLGVLGVVLGVVFMALIEH